MRRSPIHIRPMREEDADYFLRVHHAAMREIERVARKHSLAWLELDASVTAEPFYKALGCKIVERGEHVLGSGQPMASVKMRKEPPPASGKDKTES